MNSQVARYFNLMGAWIIIFVLMAAYLDQFAGHDLPCPLCLLQRLAMLGIGFGVLLNLRYGVRSGHYGVIILSALFGMAISIRQIILHIVPGTGSYGGAVWGLHFYTWAFIIFYCTITVVALMLFFEKQFKATNVKPWGTFMKFTAIILILIALGNTVTTFLECGPHLLCPDNPTKLKI